MSDDPEIGSRAWYERAAATARADLKPHQHLYRLVVPKPERARHLSWLMQVARESNTRCIGGEGAITHVHSPMTDDDVAMFPYINDRPILEGSLNPRIPFDTPCPRTLKIASACYYCRASVTVWVWGLDQTPGSLVRQETDSELPNVFVPWCPACYADQVTIRDAAVQ